MKLARLLLLLALLSGLAALVPAAATSASWPYDVAGGSGRLYVVEYAANRLAVRSESGQLLRYVGTRGAGPGQLNHPTAVAVDTKRGHVYVADSGNHRVSVFSLNGDYLYSFGHFSLAVLPGTFYLPAAIAVGPQRGYVYIADRHYMIQVFTPEGRFVRRWGHRSVDRLRGSWIHFVDGLAVANGRVYAADRIDDKIRVFSVAGAPVASYGPKVGDWTLDRPSGVDVGPDGSIYVSDGYDHLASHASNEKLVRLSATGGLLGVWGARCVNCGRGVGSNAPGAFFSPQGVAVINGRLYVADSGNDRVQVFDLNVSFLTAW